MAKHRFDYQAQLSRHSHDTSAGYTSSLCPGAIVPQYFDILGPGDSVYYRTHMFGRLQDVVTAFLGEVDLHIDYFFVPLQMLFTPFGQLFAQTDDLISSLFSPSDFTSNDGFPLFTAINPDSVQLINYAYGTSIDLWECEGKSIARLYDSLNHNPFFIFNQDYWNDTGHTQTTGDLDQQACQHPNTSPWLFAAYQAIYQKYYRNDEFERLDVKSYNFDYYYDQPPFNSLNLIRLRWHQRYSDYFTNVHVSPISSGVNSFGSYSTLFPNDGGSVDSLINKVDTFLNPSGSGIISQGNSPSLGSANSAFSHVSFYSRLVHASNSETDYLSASNVRALFAVDKFARIYGRADKTYDDQILAHFGIKIPHDVKHDITHLKHYKVVIQADPIYGTANTTNYDGQQFVGTIGQVGGQGQGAIDSDQEKFTAPVHGVFMAVAYLLTKPRYTSTFSKLHLLSDRLSFPIPEFDKLGVQPLYAFECNRVYNNDNFRGYRIGWQRRWAQFKEKYDRASFTFENHYNGYLPEQNNAWAPWVLARPAFGVDGFHVLGSTSSKLVPAWTLFERPDNLNSIMVVPYDGTWHDSWYQNPHTMFQTDPLITEFKCFCKKVSWMSETGEPDL